MQVLLLISISWFFTSTPINGQCTKELPMPPQWSSDRDTSGLRPNRAPPIPIGSTVTYKCPQMKSINGQNKFSLKCKEDQTYSKLISSWAECQCDEDLTEKCPGLTYKIGYVYKKNDQPSITFYIPQNQDKSKDYKPWKIVLQMDQNVQELQARTSDASMTIEEGGDTINLVPLANNDYKVPTAKVRVDFVFKNRATLEHDSDGYIPRWRYPCVSKVVHCGLKPDESFATASIIVMVSVVIGVSVILICLCACCHVCMLKNSGSNSIGSTRSSISSMDMEVDNTFNSRKTTPNLSEEEDRQRRQRY